jgi:hypothetical protein
MTVHRKAARGTAVVAIAVLGCALAVGCKSHETPAEQSQQVKAQEDADVANYEAQIRKVVKDPARADQLVALLSQVQILVHDAAGTVRNERAEIAALNADYKASRVDYDRVFALDDPIHQSYLKRGLELRQEMAALMTDDEWEQLKSVRVKALDAILEDLEQ